MLGCRAEGHTLFNFGASSHYSFAPFAGLCLQLLSFAPKLAMS